MTRRLAFFLAWCSVATGAAAQVLPSEPVTFGGGRAVLSGDVSATVSPDDPGFFNYSDYEHNTLRTLRLGVAGLFRLTDRISLLGDLRSENLDGVWPVALYARIRPFPGRRLDVQVGRIPPAFGGFARRTYGKDNPLIGSPLAYQYLTSLRADALPADLDELLAMRGRGWLSSFTVGDATPARGVPLVSSFTFDTGVQLTTGWRMVEVTGALTTGTLSNPRVSDDNAGKQLAGRMVVTPATGLVIGSSFARGAFVSRGAVAASGLTDEGRYTQTVQGLDVEYSRGHWIARADAVWSAWRIPLAAAGRRQTLRASAVAVEGRYTVLPGAYAAIRAEHLGFSRVATAGGALPWDAPVSRIEVGGGYALQRNVIARISWQVNRRDAGRVTRARLLAGQLLFWF
jgi:hypothetical protein